MLKTLPTLVMLVCMASLPASLCAEPIVAPAARPATLAIATVAIHGTGPIPMILVPGLSCDASIYDEFVKRNESAYTMYCVTLAGFGGTPAMSTAVDPDYAHTAWLNAAEQGLVDLVAEKKLDHPVLMGHSLGGFLAQRTAADHPGLFRAAITIDGYPAFPMQGNVTPEARAKLINLQVAPGLNRASTQPTFAAQQGASMGQLVTSQERAKELAALSAKTPGPVTARYILELLASDITAKVQSCQTPVLAVLAVGGQTAFVQQQTLTVIDHTYGSAKNVTVVTVMKSRHFIMDDAPAALDTAVSDFVNHRPPTTRVSAEARPAAPTHP